MACEEKICIQNRKLYKGNEFQEKVDPVSLHLEEENPHFKVKVSEAQNKFF